MRTSRRTKWKWKGHEIPEALMVEVTNAVQQAAGCCADGFRNEDREALREGIGSSFAHISLDELGLYATALRKGDKLEKMNGGHSPGKSPTLSAEYQEHVKSIGWKELCHSVKEAYGWRCALCNSDGPLQLHHRTYKNLGHEKKFDCLPLCGSCHKWADRRRKYDVERGRNTVDQMRMF